MSDTETPSFIEALEAAAKVLVEGKDADILLYTGPIDRPHDDTVGRECRTRTRRPNVYLLLCTMGGDPDAAYRIARHLQRYYKKFTVVISGYCKSAGTLIVLGANEIVMGEDAELGPLDMQVLKDDELRHQSSGLTPHIAMARLEQRARQAFEVHYWALKERLHLTTPTAANVASGLTAELYGQIFRQIDPMRVGELGRLVEVAQAYGQRLTKNSGNMKDADTLPRLISGYPSHSFVIDREEAEAMFNIVREPVPEEQGLLTVLQTFLRSPIASIQAPLIAFVNPSPEVLHA